MSAKPGEGTDVPTDIDIHTTAGKLADLDRRIDEAVHAASAKAVEKQHAKGKKTARERIEALFDEGSFVELDELARHRSTAFASHAGGFRAGLFATAVTLFVFGLFKKVVLADGMAAHVTPVYAYAA
ncbi:MAG TPA: carboxyl transferase domain-containing protein, partial [Marmoricola sp.]|nr:carboxyl transferase domain-containing protein [Marmoricola sp.]